MFDPKEKELLNKAFQRYHQEIDAALPEEQWQDTAISPELERRMEKTLGKQTNFYYSFINTAAKRVACILAAVLLAATVTTVSVEALREGFVHFVVELFDGGSTVAMPGKPHPLNPKTPGYIPEGYRRISETINDHTIIQFYGAEHRRNFQFSQHPKGTNISVYTENTDYRTVTLGGQYEGILFENSGETFLIFNDTDQMYAVIGALSEEEILKIANSLFETR